MKFLISIIITLLSRHFLYRRFPIPPAQLLIVKLFHVHPFLPIQNPSLRYHPCFYFVFVFVALFSVFGRFSFTVCFYLYLYLWHYFSVLADFPLFTPVSSLLLFCFYFVELFPCFRLIFSGR